MVELRVDDLDKVLRKTPKNKAGRADHLQPQELMVLPRVIKEGLTRWLNQVEAVGKWPTSFNCAFIALIGKEGGHA